MGLVRLLTWRHTPVVSPQKPGCLHRNCPAPLNNQAPRVLEGMERRLRTYPHAYCEPRSRSGIARHGTHVLQVMVVSLLFWCRTVSKLPSLSPAWRCEPQDSAPARGGTPSALLAAHTHRPTVAHEPGPPLLAWQETRACNPSPECVPTCPYTCTHTCPHTYTPVSPHKLTHVHTHAPPPAQARLPFRLLWLCGCGFFALPACLKDYGECFTTDLAYSRSGNARQLAKVHRARH